MEFEIFQIISSDASPKKEWYWRLYNPIDNETFAWSAHGHETKESCENAMHRVMMTDYATKVVYQNPLDEDMINRLITEIRDVIGLRHKLHIY
jgi:hypothetical protein